MGRPPSFASPEALEALADGYFDGLAEDAMPTVSGLCLALGCCRDTLWEYTRKPEFSDAIKGARTRLEVAWELRLAGPNAGGAIFWLKNQGWRDTHDVNTNVRVGLADILAGIGKGETK